MCVFNFVANFCVNITSSYFLKIQYKVLKIEVEVEVALIGHLSVV